MPPHGKPLSHSFHHATQPSSQVTGGAGAMEYPGGGPLPRKKKGISGLAGADQLKRISLRQASLISALAHATAPFLLTGLMLLVLLLLSWLLHFNLWDWLKPKPTRPDMVFSLVSDTHAKKPDEARFKGNFNQQAGGKRTHTPRPAESTVRPQAPRQPKHQASPPKPQVKAPSPQPPQPPRPVAHRQRPTPKPQPVKKPPETLPSPTIAKPSRPVKQLATQPERQSHTEQTRTAENTPSRKGAPSMQARTPSAETAPQASGALSEQADQGGPASKSGVDVAQDVNYGPFMADLERRIRRNWQAPRMDRSVKIIVEFYVGRNGQLVSAGGELLSPEDDLMDAVKILKSSGNPESDRAAVEAVRLSAPFHAFPPQEKADLLPINFTFDYNVLNPGGSRRASKS